MAGPSPPSQTANLGASSGAGVVFSRTSNSAYFAPLGAKWPGFILKKGIARKLRAGGKRFLTGRLEFSVLLVIKLCLKRLWSLTVFEMSSALIRVAFFLGVLQRFRVSSKKLHISSAQRCQEHISRLSEKKCPFVFLFCTLSFPYWVWAEGTEAWIIP